MSTHECCRARRSPGCGDRQQGDASGVSERRAVSITGITPLTDKGASPLGSAARRLLCSMPQSGWPTYRSAVLCAESIGPVMITRSRSLTATPTCATGASLNTARGLKDLIAILARHGVAELAPAATTTHTPPESLPAPGSTSSGSAGRATQSRAHRVGRGALRSGVRHWAAANRSAPTSMALSRPLLQPSAR